MKVSYQVIKKVGTEEEGKNRLIFDDLITQHSNPVVEEITRNKLNKYLKAIGKPNGLEDIDNDFSRLDGLLDSPFIAVVGIQEQEGYNPRNVIKAFKAR